MALSCPLTGMGAGLEAAFRIPNHRCNHARMANSYTSLEAMPSLVGRSFKDFTLITGNFVWGRRGRSISAARCHFLFTRRREDAKIFINAEAQRKGERRGLGAGVWFPVRLQCRP